MNVLAELLDHPDVHEELELRSSFGLMAFHGGSLERMTDRIAREAADRAGTSLYAVVQPPDFRWHVPSVAFDPAESPNLERFLDHVEVVVALHGFGRDGLFTTLLAGGQNRDLARHVAGHVRRELPEYRVLDELDAIPRGLRGLDPRNPVNRARGGGVQLELPPRIRGLGPHWAGHPHGIDPGATAPPRAGLVPHTASLVDALADAATTWLT